MGVVMSDEINSDGDDSLPEVSIAEFAALKQQVRDHIRVCDRLRILNRWMAGLVVLTLINIALHITEMMSV